MSENMSESDSPKYSNKGLAKSHIIMDDMDFYRLLLYEQVLDDYGKHMCFF